MVDVCATTWSRRVCGLYPDNFVGVCQLPQSPGVAPERCIPELERCVNELGFIGCNLNPDPSGGHWKEPPLTDRWWYPLYETMVELDVPAMVHVSTSCNPAFHATGAHYINADTTAFMQFLTSDLFRDFPTLKFIIPHGGGAVPYHWGRYRGLAQDMKRPPLKDHLLNNVYFDTCVYHRPGIELLTKVIPVDNILFASEMVGAVRGIDPETGHHYDDTRRYVDQMEALSADDRHKIFEGNARRVFPRLGSQSARDVNAAARRARNPWRLKRRDVRSMNLLAAPRAALRSRVWAPILPQLSAVAQCDVAEYSGARSLVAMAKGVLAGAPATFALAGHSMGGRVALEIVRRAPERVERLALLDTGFRALPTGAAGEQERARRRSPPRVGAGKGNARNGARMGAADGPPGAACRWYADRCDSRHVRAPDAGRIRRTDRGAARSTRCDRAVADDCLPDARACLAARTVGPRRRSMRKWRR